MLHDLYKDIQRALSLQNVKKLNELLLLAKSYAKFTINKTFGSSAQSFLHICAATGNLELCQILVDEGILIDLEDSNKNTPLLTACESGSYYVCQFLLGRFANPNHQNLTGSTGLHIASKNGYVNILELLCINSAKLDVLDCDGNSPLMVACLSNKADCVKFLLLSGSNIYFKNDLGLDSYEIAAQQINPLVCIEIEKVSAMMELKGLISTCSDESSMVWRSSLQKFIDCPFYQFASEYRSLRIHDSHSYVLEICFENERKGFFGKYSSSNLSRNDMCGMWSDLFGQHRPQSAFHLPNRTWKWLSDWICVDEGNWLYSRNFSDSIDLWKHEPCKSTENVRRRVWARLRGRDIKLGAKIFPSPDLNICDYVERAQSVLTNEETNPTRRFDDLESAVQILLSGYKNDKDFHRKAIAAKMIKNYIEEAEVLKKKIQESSEGIEDSVSEIDKLFSASHVPLSFPIRQDRHESDSIQCKEKDNPPSYEFD